MSVPSAAPLALALVLVTGAAASQPAPAPRSAPLRSIELRATVPGAEPEVFIRPGASTVLTFDGELARDPEGRLQVELERRAAFTHAEVGETVLRLIPSGELKAGDRPRLTVRFQDGAALSEATFVLVVNVDRADRLVEVYREARPSESPSPEAREEWEAVRQCHEALSRARAMPVGPGLTGLRVSAAMGDNGIVTRTLPVPAPRLQDNSLLATQLRTFRAERRVLVELSLSAGPRTPSWKAEGATLTGGRGETLKVLSVWQESPVSSEDSSWVLVEAEANEAMSPGAWTLSLRGEGTGQELVLGNITFARLARPEDGG